MQNMTFKLSELSYDAQAYRFVSRVGLWGRGRQLVGKSVTTRLPTSHVSYYMQNIILGCVWTLENKKERKKI